MNRVAWYFSYSPSFYENCVPKLPKMSINVQKPRMPLAVSLISFHFFSGFPRPKFAKNFRKSENSRGIGVFVFHVLLRDSPREVFEKTAEWKNSGRELGS